MRRYKVIEIKHGGVTSKNSNNVQRPSVTASNYLDIRERW